MEGGLSGSSIVVATKDQVFSDLDGEWVILGLKSGVYYGLSDVGARIWSMVQEPRAVDEIRDEILKEYDIEPGRCEKDVLALLEKLADAGLIELKDETDS